MARPSDVALDLTDAPEVTTYLFDDLPLFGTDGGVALGRREPAQPSSPSSFV